MSRGIGCGACALVLQLALQGTSAFVVAPGARTAAVRSSSSSSSTLSATTTGSSDLTSWREKLDVLLDPRVSFAEKEVIGKDIINDIPQASTPTSEHVMSVLCCCSESKLSYLLDG